MAKMNTFSSQSDRSRHARMASILDMLWLLVLIVIGGCLGFAFGHAIAHQPPSRMLHSEPTSAKMAIIMERFCAYAGAATVVGFGLCNRLLRRSMFCVPIGSLPGLIIIGLLSYLIGFFCLPGVLLWRIGACVSLWRPHAR